MKPQCRSKFVRRWRDWVFNLKTSDFNDKKIKKLKAFQQISFLLHGFPLLYLPQERQLSPFDFLNFDGKDKQRALKSVVYIFNYTGDL